MATMATMGTTAITITGTTATEDLDWRWEWDCWVMAWAAMSTGLLIIRLRMATETVTAILLPGTRLPMVTRLITDIRSLMGIPLLLRLLPLRLFTSSSGKPCRSSRKLKLPTIGTTAGTRKGIIPT